MIPIGASLKNEGTFFRVWAPNAESVDLILYEDEKSPQDQPYSMKKKDNGYYEIFVEKALPQGLYKYRLNQLEDLPDPASRYQPFGPQGPSQVVDSHFKWADAFWKGVDLEDLVIYELHVGTFTKEGTFQAIHQHLERLQDLGVTAIELMPLAQFSGRRNWGYDGVDLFAPQNSYGGSSLSPLELKSLVNACHQHGIAVILDVVYNHLGPEGNYLGKWGPYFQDRYQTPWGAAVNFDGAGSDEVRNFFLENIRTWIEEFHIDGIRMDATHAIFDNSAFPFLEEASVLIKELEESRGRCIYLFAEDSRNDARMIRSFREGGFSMDGLWMDDFHHAIHAFLTGEKQGYYSDYGDKELLLRAFQKGLIYQGDYSKYLQHSRGRGYQGISRQHFVVCSQNHDQIGNRKNGDRLLSLLGLKKQRWASTCVLLSGCLPLIFMGEEVAAKNPFLYFVDHKDSKLNKAVRDGRKKEFTSFGGNVPDPASEESFERCQIDWDQALEDMQSQSVQKDYRRLIMLSKWLRREGVYESTDLQVKLIENEEVLRIQGTGFHWQVQIYFSLSEKTQTLHFRERMEDWDVVYFSESDWELSLEKGFCDLPSYEVLVIAKRREREQ